MNTLVFVLTTFALGVLCAIPGVVVGRLLATKGILREKPVWVCVASVCGLFVYRLWFPQVHLVYLLVIVTVLLPLGMYRQDLWTYLRGGQFSKSNK